MRFGADAIEKQGKYGMPKEHMIALRDATLANPRDPLVIGVRPVSPYATSFIREGYPTKPFIVKNKTSNSGITAGLIAINPLYSRVNSDQYASHNEQLAKAFAKDKESKEKKNENKNFKLAAINLEISANRLETLDALFGSKINIEKKNENLYGISWEKEGKTIHAYAEKNKDNQNFSIFDAEHNPIEVLGREITDAKGNTKTLPITADYDLFIVCPHEKNYEPGKGKKDHTPHRIAGSSYQKNQALIAAREKDPNYTGALEDPYGGNWPPRVQETANLINQRIAAHDDNRKGFGLEIVHHNAEVLSPYADELENHLPCLFILPPPMNLCKQETAADKMDSIVLIETVAELNWAKEQIQKQGFHWPSQAKFEKDLPASRQDQRDAAQNFPEMLARQQAFAEKKPYSPKPISPKDLAQNAASSTNKELQGAKPSVPGREPQITVKEKGKNTGGILTVLLGSKKASIETLQRKAEKKEEKKKEKEEKKKKNTTTLAPTTPTDKLVLPPITHTKGIAASSNTNTTKNTEKSPETTSPSPFSRRK